MDQRTRFEIENVFKRMAEMLESMLLVRAATVRWKSETEGDVIAMRSPADWLKSPEIICSFEVAPSGYPVQVHCDGATSHCPDFAALWSVCEMIVLDRKQEYEEAM
jgi:hypothetical protein